MPTDTLTAMIVPPKYHPLPVSAAPVQKRKHTWKVDCLAKDEDESRPSWEHEKEPGAFI